MEKKNFIKSIILIVFLLIVFFGLKALLPDDKITYRVKELDDDTLYLESQEVINQILQDDEHIENNFYIEDIYYKEKDGIKVLFIHGFIEVLDDSVSIINNVNYVMKLDSITYEIASLENVDDIVDYANDYEMDNIEITNGQILPSTLNNTQTKLEVYISRFIGLLSSDPDRAYNLLRKNEQKKYSDFDDFKSNAINNYNNISTYIKEYDENKGTYDITDDQGNKIKIVENRSMKYTIEFN